MTHENRILEHCPICIEIISDKDSCITSCDHKFCLSCILESCKYKNTCPICRIELYEYNISNDYENNNENEENQNEIIPIEIENQMTLRLIRNILENNIQIRNNHEFIEYTNYMRYTYNISMFGYNFLINPVKNAIKHVMNITSFTMLTTFGLYIGLHYANKVISYFSYK